MHLPASQWLWVVISALASAVTIVFIKKFALTNTVAYAIIALLSQLVALYSYYQLFKQGSIALLYALVKIVTILLVIATGLILFQERLTPLQWVGVGLAIGAIVLLSWN